MRRTVAAFGVVLALVSTVSWACSWVVAGRGTWGEVLPRDAVLWVWYPPTTTTPPVVIAELLEDGGRGPAVPVNRTLRQQSVGLPSAFRSELEVQPLTPLVVGKRYVVLEDGGCTGTVFCEIGRFTVGDFTAGPPPAVPGLVVSWAAPGTFDASGPWCSGGPPADGGEFHWPVTLTFPGHDGGGRFVVGFDGGTFSEPAGFVTCRGTQRSEPFSWSLPAGQQQLTVTPVSLAGVAGTPVTLSTNLACPFPDGGSGTSEGPPSGCGCNAVDPVLPGVLALVALLRRSRRQATR